VGTCCGAQGMMASTARVTASKNYAKIRFR
jgi:hypothetical protein